MNYAIKDPTIKHIIDTMTVSEMHDKIEELKEVQLRISYEYGKLVRRDAARLRKIYGKRGDVSDMPYSEETQAVGKQLGNVAGKIDGIKIALKYLAYLAQAQPQ